MRRNGNRGSGTEAVARAQMDDEEEPRHGFCAMKTAHMSTRAPFSKRFFSFLHPISLSHFLQLAMTLLPVLPR